MMKPMPPNRRAFPQKEAALRKKEGLEEEDSAVPACVPLIPRPSEEWGGERALSYL